MRKIPTASALFMHIRNRALNYATWHTNTVYMVNNKPLHITKSSTLLKSRPAASNQVLNEYLIKLLLEYFTAEVREYFQSQS